MSSEPSISALFALRVARSLTPPTPLAPLSPLFFHPTFAHAATPEPLRTLRSLHWKWDHRENRPGAPKKQPPVNLLPLVVRFRLRIAWSWRRDLNPRPSDYKSDALPAELRQPKAILRLNRRAGTLPFSAHYGTETKVSTAADPEQTQRKQGTREQEGRDWGPGTKGLRD